MSRNDRLTKQPPAGQIAKISLFYFHQRMHYLFA